MLNENKRPQVACGSHSEIRRSRRCATACSRELYYKARDSNNGNPSRPNPAPFWLMINRFLFQPHLLPAPPQASLAGFPQSSPEQKQQRFARRLRFRL